MKKLLIQLEGKPDNCNGCEFLLETNDTYICGSTLIYKLLEPEPIRKRPNKSKKRDNGKS